MSGQICLSNSLFNVKKQFFAAVSLKNFKWQQILDGCCDETTGLDLQNDLLNATVFNTVIETHPVRKSYQKPFLKKIISYLENENADISDRLYKKYVDILNCSKEEKGVYLHFFDENQELVVSIAETLSVISNGTTGLSTWPAARVLAEFCSHNQHLFRGKNILEFGCGTGLLGLAVTKACLPKSYIFTDCHPDVLNLVTSNIRLSLENTALQSNSENREIISKEKSQLIEENTSNEEHFKAQYENTTITVLNLPWEEVSLETLEPYSPNVILAADVIYDTTSIPPLVSALKSAFAFPSVRCLVACAVRNPETFSTFLKEVESLGGTLNDVQQVPAEMFYACADVPLKILDISFGE